MAEQIDHPAHYGGADNPYEAIKVIEAWGLGFCLGNSIKYISRAGKKGDAIEDLKKARWYIDHEIERQERAPANRRASEDSARDCGCLVSEASGQPAISSAASGDGARMAESKSRDELKTAHPGPETEKE